MVYSIFESRKLRKKLARKKYFKSEKGKLALARYKRGVNGKLSDEKFRNSEKRMKSYLKYWNSPKGKAIRAANKQKRLAQIKLATPKWANKEEIKKIYLKCPEGYHVDHVIPLLGKDVCGLHVEYNLQYIDKIQNIKKGNKNV